MAAIRYVVPQNASVGFLGPAQSFSHLLAQKEYPGREFFDYGNFQDAFAALLDQKCNFVLIPFFNTNARDVIEAQKEILRYQGKIFVNDLLGFDIQHHACGYGNLQDIKEVHSKRPVERQISRWLTQEVPHAVFKETKSTSAAIQQLAETKSLSVCAIGSSEAAAMYKVPIIREQIQNKPNRTLFFLLSTSCPVVIKLETIILATTGVTDNLVEKMVELIESHECGMSAMSKFSLDGIKCAYFEVRAFHANLNLHSLVQQATAQFGATFLGGYNNTSIVNLVTV